MIAVHAGGPIRTNPLEMQRLMPMILQSEPELFARLSPHVRSQCLELLTERGARRGLHAGKRFFRTSTLSTHLRNALRFLTIRRVGFLDGRAGIDAFGEGGEAGEFGAHHGQQEIDT